MKAYLKAENLKLKRSFIKKIIFIMPLLSVAYSFLIMPQYFSVNSYNRRYMILMPATLSLLAATVHKKEEDKLSYRAVFSLDVDLEKIWYAKILVIAFYFFMALCLHLLLTYFVQTFFVMQMVEGYSLIKMFEASIFLFLSSLWQIPFTLFLAKKLSYLFAILINTGMSILLSILVSDKTYGIFFPHSYPARLMIPSLKILPNGLLADSSNLMLTNTPILELIALSLVLFFLISFLSGKNFANSEVK